MKNTYLLSLLLLGATNAFVPPASANEAEDMAYCESMAKRDAVSADEMQFYIEDCMAEQANKASGNEGMPEDRPSYDEEGQDQGQPEQDMAPPEE